MDGHEEISERCLSAREISLQEKIVRLENQLQGYKSQLDILENQRQKLEEISFKMESALTKTKKELLEAKQEVLNKEIAEIQLSEKLKSMTLKADEFERLFLAESSKSRCSLERLEKILSKGETDKAHEATQDRFEGLKEILNVVQEGFTAQVKMILDKITEAENNFCGSLQEGRTSNFTNNTHDDDGEDSAKDFHPDDKCSNVGLADQSKPIFESTSLTSKQPSSARGAIPQPIVKGPLKIDSSFFAGLSSSKSPERRVEEPEEPAMSPTSPGRVRNDSNISYTEDIHFEPVIPLPEQIEVQTGEEEEELMFSNRAKLYRYDKGVSAWKDRGIGTMKILFHAEKGRSRILMRREVVHKLCANHLITTDMKLEEKKGAANTLIWSTLADFSEEVSNPEQLAIKFKTQDEVLLFKKTFEECQEMLKKDVKRQGDTADTSKEVSDLMATFAPKPGSWSCSVCLISNEEHTTVCVACGAVKLLESSEFTRAQAQPNSEVQLTEDLIGSSAPGSVSCSSESPFTFKMSDSRTLSTSPLTVSVVGKSSPSPFTFGNPSEAGRTTSTLFGAPSEAPVTSNAATATTQPFVLPAFGIPSISGNSSQPSVTFRTSSSTGSAPAQPAVSGGGPPEQNVSTMSFGLFGSGASSKSSPSPFTFGNLSTASTTTSTLFRAPSEARVTSKAATVTAQPFVLPGFGVPTISSNSSRPSVTFRTSSSTGSSPASAAPAQPAVSGGGPPEQNVPTMSFDLFGTGTSSKSSLSPFAFGNLSTASTTTSTLFGAASEAPVTLNAATATTQPFVLPAPGVTTISSNSSQPSLTFGTSSSTGSSPASRAPAQPAVSGGGPPEQNVPTMSFGLFGSGASSKSSPSPFAFGNLSTASTTTSTLFGAPSEAPVTSKAATATTQLFVLPAPGVPTISSNSSQPSLTFGTSSSTGSSPASTQRWISPNSTVKEQKDSDSDKKEEYIRASMFPPQKPTSQTTQTQPSSFSLGQGKGVTTPEMYALVQPSAAFPLRQFLVAHSRLKKIKKQDDDCVLVYEVHASIADREKATRLLLPPKFFNYAKLDRCPGCIGCVVISKGTVGSSNKKVEEKEPEITRDSSENGKASTPGTFAGPVFGQ